MEKKVILNPLLDKLYKEFKQNAEAIAAEVYRVIDPAEAQRLVAELVSEIGVDTVVSVDSPLIKALELEKILPADTSVALEASREKAASADLGISELDLAIVETGSLVQDASDINKRLVSTLPPVHIALVRTDRLVPNILEAIDLINEQLPAMSEYMAFISGPSRTADIERVLTIGVHGPGRLIIIFVD